MDYNSLIIRCIVGFMMLFFLILIISLYENALIYLVPIIYFFILIEINKNFTKGKEIIFLIFYLFFSLIFLEVYLIFYYDKLFLLLFLFIIIVFDIFSYLFGSTFGKKKILPNISPNKTVLGLISGICFSIMFALGYNHFVNIIETKNLLILTFLIIIFSFFGDILESKFKRLSNIKNSSNFIPGHGGFFDRFDSLISSSYLLFFYNYFIS